MEKLKKLWRKIPWRWVSYFGTVYIVLMVVVSLMYLIITPIAKPLIALILPIDPRNSLSKMLTLYTVFFWGTVAFKTWRRYKKNKKKN